jgi:hypothetical protein
LTEIYDDRILAFTSPIDWISTNDLCRLVKGNKSAIIPAIKELEKREYLESRTKGNTIEYRRIDKAQSNEQFDSMIENFKVNKQTAINQIVLHNYSDVYIELENYSILTKKGKLTKKCDATLDWIQTELLDRAFMVMSRLMYQDTLKLLPHSVVKKRLQIIQNFIDSVMKSLEPLKNEKLITERFQNHTHKFEHFKV